MTSTSRTARCGPACRVVWQGRSRHGCPLCRSETLIRSRAWGWLRLFAASTRARPAERTSPPSGAGLGVGAPAGLGTGIRLTEVRSTRNDLNPLFSACCCALRKSWPVRRMLPLAGAADALHRANCSRKPRAGLLAEVRGDSGSRFSFCCHRRTTSMPVCFLGRRFYLVLGSARHAGQTPATGCGCPES